ncbi:hypothetical protein NW77_038 [Erwinia phage phiEa2809]|uniref:Uncharacterized protein n=1 Tax=Erwinia phage phiEa2809 TaxID=1564096 RepID=A0A0A0YVD4_9CAUD|nr:hypothetical protein NW77_038 [Erwinia phage phiEa2809]AIX13046.1 hypothetical protein NW77_038 [Erwinia phage phiEa2809]
MNLVSTQDGLSKFAIDIITKDVEGLMLELDAVACGLDKLPEDLGQVATGGLQYRITCIPEDISHQDVMGVMNQSLHTGAIIRTTVIGLLRRVNELEQAVPQERVVSDNSELSKVADVLNTVTEKMFGHKMIDIDPRHKYEVKPKWLH